MTWLTENWIWVLLMGAFVVMHLLGRRGHGTRGAHGSCCGPRGHGSPGSGDVDPKHPGAETPSAQAAAARGTSTGQPCH